MIFPTFEILVIGIIVSSILALFLEEVVYSVAALAGTLFLTALLYMLNGAIFAGIFQFAVSVGTLAVLFLSGEMLGDKTTNKSSLKRISALICVGIFLSLPVSFLSISGSFVEISEVSFGNALWNMRDLDAILQALVILTVALGIPIILYEKRKGDQ